MTELWLPEDLRVYVSPDGGVANAPFEGGEERALPTVNLYQGEDGGYVAVYSRHAGAGVYSVGGGIYVVGQVRLRGRYVGRVFRPTGFEQRDISAASEIGFVCNQAFGGETRAALVGAPLERELAISATTEHTRRSARSRPGGDDRLA